MTVKELIEYLKEFDSNSIVLLKKWDYYEYEIEIKTTVQSTGDWYEKNIILF